MTKKPKEKKSEGLDVRLPFSVKKKFMAATKARGETASAAVRRFIDGYIAETEAALSKPPLKEVAMTARRNPLKSLAIAGTALGAMSLAALPSAAENPSEIAFVYLENPAVPRFVQTLKDGSIQIINLDVNGDQKITWAEVEASVGEEIETSYFRMRPGDNTEEISMEGEQLSLLYFDTNKFELTPETGFDPENFQALDRNGNAVPRGKIVFWHDRGYNHDGEFANKANDILNKLKQLED